MSLSRILLLTICVQAILAQAALAGTCIDCPTPNPCAAEGGCSPRAATWGYYPQRWNRWPTDYDDTKLSDGKESGLPSPIIPDPEDEDQAAPAPSDAEEETPTKPQPGEGARELDLPALPPLPGLPAEQPAAPANEGNDPPPGLPPLPGFGAPPGISPPPRTTPPGQTRIEKPSSNDAPPPLPTGFARLLKPRSGVVQAAYPKTRPAEQPRVSRAYHEASPSDRPALVR